MTRCEFVDVPDVELYFYEELDASERIRVEAHLHQCAACRQRLDDLHAIRRALALRPAVDAPPAGDWSGFMRRLDAACRIDARATAAGRRWRWRAAAIAAMLALVTASVWWAGRLEHAPAPRTAAVDAPGASNSAPREAAVADKSLREGTAEHLERSKLVVLGLTTLDPDRTKADDWQYERQLAGTLLSDTRLYRRAAQDRGMDDVARVMRDLETVLIETSMSDNTDRAALARVQRLISKRDLVVKMQLVASNAAGT